MTKSPKMNVSEAFERAFDNMSDDDLRGIHSTIQEWKTRSPMSYYREVARHPFTREIVFLVDNQQHQRRVARGPST